MSEQTPTSEIRSWDPFGDLDLFTRWDPFRRLVGVRGPFASGVGRWAPSLDVSEDDERFTISVELPGAKKDDVTVEVHDGMLTVRGEKRSEREEMKEQRRYVERSFGSFSRSITLPANADGDRVEASFKDGVLTVQIPKRGENKPKTISVK